VPFLQCHAFGILQKNPDFAAIASDNDLMRAGDLKIALCTGVGVALKLSLHMQLTHRVNLPRQFALPLAR
jgi:hypothetical protein